MGCLNKARRRYLSMFSQLTHAALPWQVTTGLLCGYGFLKELRPSEPYLTEYLAGPSHNISLEDINGKIYPVWTYSYLLLLIPVFLLTDLLRYKPVVIVEALAYIVTWLVLLFGQGVGSMQLMQFIYGVATATEIAYFSYIYAAVQPEHYQKVTSLVRGALLCGRVSAGIVGQVVVSLHLVSYYSLNWISLVFVSIAFLVAIFLPSVYKNVYFQPDRTSQTPVIPSEIIQDGSQGVANPNYYDEQEQEENCVVAEIHTSASDNKDVSEVEQEHIIKDLTNTRETLVQSECDGAANQSTSSSLFPEVAILQVTSDSIGDMPSDKDAQGDSTSATGTETHQTSLPITTDTLHQLRPDTLSSLSDTHSLDGSITPPKRSIPAACCRRNFGPILTDLVLCYGNKNMLKWSIWWAVATCGYFQVGNYVQNLWEYIHPSAEHPDQAIYNGAVEAGATLLGAIVTFSLMALKANWSMYGELFLGISSIIQSGLLFTMAMVHNIWLAYACYVLYRAIYQMIITIASFQIATYLEIQRYALVFGCNTFVALSLQSILTAVVVDKSGLGVDIVTQFLVTACYVFLMGTIFLTKATYTLAKTGCGMAWQRRFVERYQQLDTDSVTSLPS